MKKIVKRILLVLPAVILQILWYVVLFAFIKDKIPFISELLTFMALFFVLHIVNDQSQSSYKMMWVLLIMTFPVLGVCLYIIAGKNRTSKNLDKYLTKSKEELNYELKTSEQVQSELKEKNLHLSQTLNCLSNYCGSPITYMKNYIYYPLGDNMFPDMIRAVKQAKKFIYMEYFIVEEGRFYNSLIDIFKEKVKEGVDVRIIYDDVGSVSTYSFSNVKELESYGIKCIPFNPLLTIKAQLNNRDHRKMLIVDNEIGFSGGVNIADEYINEKERFGHWKDIGFCIDGDALNHYTYMFIEMWNAFSKDKIQKENCLLPVLHNINYQKGYVLSYYDSPAKDVHVSRSLLMDLFHNANKRVWIYTPYLILDDSMMDCLSSLAFRGVDVRIMVPAIPDKKVVYRISLSYCKSLIEAGVKIYTYTPGFLHAKAVLIDDDICTVGTVNLDYRSLYLHYECNSVFYQCDIYNDVKKDMEDTMEKSHLLQKNEIKNSWFYNVINEVLRLFSPLL
ncbi:cardiolipin synthase [Floccifex sp.]|uniref:cardiolipin synthase n=1 Tax=Floccifex sp. TaxID=2815810 RepID=UPI002A763024|nr:cardiolipin synthase [Floccifex sp.]MDD7281968.1 cardiolipin synthase [Erysipelotrichaceae bacterium]MDY2957877.1 cardiolipin synthase [Floccifex sp.]